MTRRTDALAQVYARSLYELAEQAGGREKILEVAEELEQTCELVRSDKAFGEFLGSPIIDRARRGGALGKIFHGRVTDLVLRFLLVLTRKGRLGHLESIADAFDQLVHESFGRVEVDVYTPGDLDAEQLDSLKKRIGTALEKEPILHHYADPSLLGGLMLRIGDQLIDGSVAGRLRRMRQGLLSSGGPALRNRVAAIIEEGADQ